MGSRTCHGHVPRGSPIPTATSSRSKGPWRDACTGDRGKRPSCRSGRHRRTRRAGPDRTGGSVTGVLGPNGAGKTTFVRAVATLRPYQSGVLHVGGLDVATSPHGVRRAIGLAGQQAAVIAQLTARENLLLVARLYGLSRHFARRRVEEVIEACDLEAFADRRAAACSGGQRRRLDLAASLVSQPPVLLLDEPTTGLDPASRIALWQLVRQLPDRGTSVLLTTQHLDEATALADHIVILDRGRRIAAGTPLQLRQSASTTSLTISTTVPVPTHKQGELAAALGAELEQHGPSIRLLGRFCLDEAYAAILATGISPQITELALQPPTLEEVFLDLTAEHAETKP